MSFLSINQYALSILQDDVDCSFEQYGSEGPAYDGTWLRTVRARKRVWGSMSTAPMSRLDAIALAGLLEGLGHHWSFDDSTDFSYSSKGLPIFSSTAAPTYGTTSPSPKFGAGRLKLDATKTVTWPTAFGGSTAHYTLMVWKWSGSVWNHYILRKDGAKWVDGVRNDGASTPFFAVVSGNARLGDTGSGSDQFFDGFVTLPFLISAGMATAFGTATTAFSALPKLTMTGDIVPNESLGLTVFGIEPTVVSTPAVISGAYDSSAASVQFSIREG